jgi:hypothetical protein
VRAQLCLSVNYRGRLGYLSTRSSREQTLQVPDFAETSHEGIDDCFEGLTSTKLWLQAKSRLWSSPSDT